MSYVKLTIEELRALINKGLAADPLVFLESVMNGQDPRKQSKLYDMVTDIDQFTDGDIPRSDWNELVNYVINNYKYQTVSMGDSMNAAKSLSEYLYPKRKQIDINDSAALGSVQTNPLTEEEIILFKEKFNDEF